jgi:hypothetical protein
LRKQHVYINPNPQTTFNAANGLVYYAINSDPNGYEYKMNTIDASGNIISTHINTRIFKIRATGSISGPITPQPPGQLWSVFHSAGVLWGTTQYAGSSSPSYSLYRLQCTTAGLPASSPFLSELVGTMPTTFGDALIVNMTLFASSSDRTFGSGFE